MRYDKNENQTRIVTTVNISVVSTVMGTTGGIYVN